MTRPPFIPSRLFEPGDQVKVGGTTGLVVDSFPGGVHYVRMDGSHRISVHLADQLAAAELPRARRERNCQPALTPAPAPRGMQMRR